MDRHEWDARYAAHEHIWSLGPNQFVAAETEALPPGRALDVAAGEGRNALWLAERGWRVTAVDWSRVGLDKARQLAERRGVTLDLVEADVTEYEPERGAYDLVLIAYLQTPADARRKWLQHAVDALAPGGTLLIVCHDRSNIEHGYGGPQDPSVLATPEEVAATLRELAPDLTIERAETVERRVDTDAGERVAIDHLVRAHRRG